VPSDRSEPLSVLRSGVEAWNRWRAEQVGPAPRLDDANLYGVVDHGGRDPTLKGYRTPLDCVNFAGVSLARATLESANLRGADLTGASLLKANLRRADLSGASLSGADLYEADLYQANLCGAVLRGARLVRARLVDADLTEADLENCSVYGVSAWNTTLDRAVQKNLLITDPSTTWEPPIWVDDLEVAQLVHLLISRAKLRQVIETVTAKMVLILGRFTADRKTILEAIREHLRARGYVPVLFDFEKPSSRDLTETVSLLAHMARFVIADITDARSIPQELQSVVPDLPSVPIKPILLRAQEEYGMFQHFKRYDWVLDVHLYDDEEQLLAELDAAVIGAVEDWLARPEGHEVAGRPPSVGPRPPHRSRSGTK
jgi:uncharacterized protein YjbI with pentapeptide repeats